MILQGEKIKLVPITYKDTEKIVEWRNKSFVKNCFIYRKTFTKEGHENWMKNMVETGKVQQFIIRLNYNDESIGSVFIRDIDYANRKGEFGIFIGEKESLSCGYGKEAAELMVKYAFEEMKIHKVFLRVLAENERAYKSYLKAGFVQEGYFKDDVWINDIPYDVIFMAQYSKEV